MPVFRCLGLWSIVLNVAITYFLVTFFTCVIPREEIRVRLGTYTILKREVRLNTYAILERKVRLSTYAVLEREVRLSTCTILEGEVTLTTCALFDKRKSWFRFRVAIARERSGIGCKLRLGLSGYGRLWISCLR